jgi:hypothetical protein
MKLDVAKAIEDWLIDETSEVDHANGSAAAELARSCSSVTWVIDSKGDTIFQEVTLCTKD